MSHYGYILRGSVTGLYKVGITNNSGRRFSQYKTHVPERVIQEGVKTFVSREEAEDWERIILHTYADRRVHGEWLDIEFSDAASIWYMGLESPGLWPVPGKHFVVFEAAGWFRDYPLRVFDCESHDCASRLIDALEKPTCWLDPEKLERAVSVPNLLRQLREARDRRDHYRRTQSEVEYRFSAMKKAGIVPPREVLDSRRADQLAWLDQHHPLKEKE